MKAADKIVELFDNRYIIANFGHLYIILHADMVKNTVQRYAKLRKMNTIVGEYKQ